MNNFTTVEKITIPWIVLFGFHTTGLSWKFHFVSIKGNWWNRGKTYSRQWPSRLKLFPTSEAPTFFNFVGIHFTMSCWRNKLYRPLRPVPTKEKGRFEQENSTLVENRLNRRAQLLKRLWFFVKLKIKILVLILGTLLFNITYWKIVLHDLYKTISTKFTKTT
jgi:hypothetical protein